MKYKIVTNTNNNVKLRFPLEGNGTWFAGDTSLIIDAPTTDIKFEYKIEVPQGISLPTTSFGFKVYSEIDGILINEILYDYEASNSTPVFNINGTDTIDFGEIEISETYYSGDILGGGATYILFDVANLSQELNIYSKIDGISISLDGIQWFKNSIPYNKVNSNIVASQLKVYVKFDAVSLGIYSYPTILSINGIEKTIYVNTNVTPDTINISLDGIFERGVGKNSVKTVNLLYPNTAEGDYSTTFGSSNSTLGRYSLTSGDNNVNNGNASLVVGEYNLGDAVGTTIISYLSKNYSQFGSIIGGMFNDININCYSSTILGAYNSDIGVVGQTLDSKYNGIYSSKECNIGEDVNHSVLVGGYLNNIIPSSTTINYAVIAGGRDNTITYDERGAIIAGFGNKLASGDCVIAGGNLNEIEGNCYQGGLVGGYMNKLATNAWRSVIVGGDNITATKNSTVYVPNLNIDTTPTQIVQGGVNATSTTNLLIRNSSGDVEILDNKQFALGYYANVGNSSYALSIGGYYSNVGSYENYSVIAGGFGNSLNYDNGTVDGGFNAIVGGYANHMLNGSQFNSIIGGYSNDISYNVDYCSIIGGKNNAIANGVQNSAIIGGDGITAVKNSCVYVNNFNIQTIPFSSTDETPTFLVRNESNGDIDKLSNTQWYEFINYPAGDLFQNDWEDYASGGYSKGAIMKTADGTVHVRGLIKNITTVANGEFIFEVPSTFAPTSTTDRRSILYGQTTNGTLRRLDLQYDTTSSKWYISWNDIAQTSVSWLSIELTWHV